MFTREEGGRRTPITDGYNPQTYFYTTDVSCSITLSDGRKEINPGDNNAKITVDLKTEMPLYIGEKFYIREGGRSVAVGYITNIYE